MSGGSVPYHLRQNKAIERNLFIELLGKLNRAHPISKYTYVGFGGPFLEDFKLFHSVFGNTNLISLESDESVYPRQQFNLPLSCINCMEMSSGSFIKSYDAEENAIIWLDYASAQERGDQLREFHSLLTKIRTYDIVKITLNANPDTLGSVKGTPSEWREKRLRKLSEQLGDYMPSDATGDKMANAGLSGVLCKALQITASRALRGRGSEMFQPLTAFVYADSAHRMLTLTGMLLPADEIEQTLKTTLIDSWDFASTLWSQPHSIDVPELTVRERLFIDAQIPDKTEEEIRQEMGFELDEDEDKSRKMLKNYMRYYRHFPYFSKIAV